MTAQDIEIAVANYLCYRANVIVPNVHWGLGLWYEADLVVLRPSGWAIEIEIKTSRSDILADLKKRRQHDSNLFRELYFAVPECLAEDPDIPERAGILSVYTDTRGVFRVTKTRAATRNRIAKKWDSETRDKLLRLAAMRTWTLKQHLQRQRKTT
jgi:hypothetical protein